MDHPADLPFALRAPRPPDQAERRHLAAERLTARRQRTCQIRKWVVGIGVAVFLAAWALVFANLVEGHDPALSKSSTAAASTPSNTSLGPRSTGSSGTTSSGSTGTGSSSGVASTGSTGTTGSDQSSSSSDSGSGSSGSTQSSSSSPSSVTTSQS